MNGTTHHADVLTYMGGPVFYITRGKSSFDLRARWWAAARELRGILISPKGVTEGLHQ